MTVGSSIGSVNSVAQAAARNDSVSFGLKNQNSSGERINALRAAAGNIDFADVYTTLSQIDSLDAKADHGLNDRNTTSERSSLAQSAQQRVVENHGFDAKMDTQNRLARNTKIVNIPPDQRGTLADLSA